MLYLNYIKSRLNLKIQNLAQQIKPSPHDQKRYERKGFVVMSILFANTLQFVNIMLYFMCTVVFAVLKRNLKQHNADYVASRRIRRLFLYDQVHIFHSFAVFRAGGNDINSSCVDTVVTKNVRKFRNIFFNAVKCACEQVA